MESRRVLVVEDEALVAMFIEDILTDLGFEVVGPAARIESALKCIQEEALDFAILDLNLANERSFPVASALRHKGVPFIFATGYGTAGLTDEFDDIATLQKPFQAEDLERIVAETIGLP